MWGVKVGEVVHNVRSALDQLVWNLVLANGETPSKDTTFPIYQSEREWLTDLEQRRRAEDRPAPLAGVAPDAFAIIKAAQPYHQRKRPDTHPLMKLLRLSNIDKHRSLHVAKITTQRISHLRLDPPGFASIRRVRYAPTGSVVENGAVVAHVQLQWKSVPDTEMQVTGKANLDVAFGQIDQPPIATIPDLYRVVIAAMEVYESLRSCLVMAEAE